MFLVNPIPVGLAERLYPNRIWRVPDEQCKSAWLTIDDGPSPESTPEVLRLLDQFGVKAHFFCSGEQVERHPELYGDIIRAGHGIGNHGWSHLNGARTAAAEYLQDVDRCSEWVSSHLFRPPYGRLSRKQERVLRRRGFRVVMWDVMAEDWKPNRTGVQCAEKVLKHLKPRSIVVWHTNHAASSRVLEGLEHLLKHATIPFDLPNL